MGEASTTSAADASRPISTGPWSTSCRRREPPSRSAIFRPTAMTKDSPVRRDLTFRWGASGAPRMANIRSITPPQNDLNFVARSWPRCRPAASCSHARQDQGRLCSVVDGLKGFPQAVTSSIVQTCIVHLIRNSLAFVSWKDREAVLPRSRPSTGPRTPTWRSRSGRPCRRCLVLDVRKPEFTFTEISYTKLLTLPGDWAILNPTNPPTGPVAHSSADTVWTPIGMSRSASC